MIFGKNPLFHVKGIEHQQVIETLVTESSPRKTYLALILFSSVVATLGLLNDSGAVVIGAMLIAPLLWPVLGVSMGALVRDFRMIKLAFLSICLSIFIAIATAMIITFFYVPLGASVEILQTTNFGFMFPVAIASGGAAALALIYPNVKEAVTGVAISVALLPPLVTVGIGLGGTDWHLMRAASELFLINLGGVVVTAGAVFALHGFFRYQRTAEVAVKKEEKVLETA